LKRVENTLQRPPRMMVGAIPLLGLRGKYRIKQPLV